MSILKGDSRAGRAGIGRRSRRLEFAESSLFLTIPAACSIAGRSRGVFAGGYVLVFQDKSIGFQAFSRPRLRRGSITGPFFNRIEESRFTRPGCSFRLAGLFDPYQPERAMISRRIQ